ncbi:50S ribosomal protein L22 [bacterium]|nr:50S ribosomal protein L22 [bacterium]
MKVIARLSDLGVPALKARRFAGTVKGQPVDRALAILELQSSPVCQALAKLVRSAAANAEHNHQLDRRNLEVANVIVDQGHMLKRIQPQARGRAYRIAKRSCHVTVVLDLQSSLRAAQQRASAGAASKASKSGGESAPASKTPRSRKKAETAG